MSPTIIYPSKLKLTLLAFGTLLFIFIGMGGLFSNFAASQSYPPILIYGISMICILFFGACFLFIIKQLLSNKAALIIDEDGITDYSSALKVGLVKWHEIEDIQFTSYMNQEFLSIYTFDKDLMVNRTNTFQKAMNRVNQKLIDSQVNIVYKNLKCDPKELIEAINYFWALAYEDKNKEG